MVTSGGLYTPTRMPQGVLNATVYFQAVMTDVLNGGMERWRLVCIYSIIV